MKEIIIQYYYIIMFIHPITYCYLYDTNIAPLNVNEIFDSTSNKTFSISINNVKPGRYRIKTYSLTRSHGSILDEWLKMGSLKNVSNNEINYFKSITIPMQSIYYENIEDCLRVSETLNACEVHLLSIKLEI